MVIELTVQTNLPLNEKSSSITKYVPKQIFQKKLFNTENIQIEEYVNSKGKLNKNYCYIKSDGEYFKVRESYETLKNKYFKNLEILGLNAKRSNYTNL